MVEKKKKLKEKFKEEASLKVTSLVRKILNDQKASEKSNSVMNKYRGLSKDELANILIKRAARKTKWEGAISGAGVTGCEIVIANPTIPEPSHKYAAGAGVVGLLLTDLTYTVKIQVQLMLEIAHIYECPFDRQDEDDVWIVFKAALGLKGAEKAGIWGKIIFNETARKQFRRLLRTGIRRAVQQKVVKIAGRQVGKYLAEKYVMRLLPIINMGIGYVFNNTVTNKIGKWAKIKSKVRSSAFKQIVFINNEEPEANIWILPIIFYIATSDDVMTDNELALYSQTVNHINFTDVQQSKRYAEIIDDEKISDIFASELKTVKKNEAKKALLDIAITTALINLKVNEKRITAVKEIAEDLGVTYKKSLLDERLKYLKI